KATVFCCPVSALCYVSGCFYSIDEGMHGGHYSRPAPSAVVGGPLRRVREPEYTPTGRGLEDTEREAGPVQPARLRSGHAAPASRASGRPEQGQGPDKPDRHPVGGGGAAVHAAVAGGIQVHRRMVSRLPYAALRYLPHPYRSGSGLRYGTSAPPTPSSRDHPRGIRFWRQRAGPSATETHRPRRQYGCSSAGAG